MTVSGGHILAMDLGGTNLRAAMAPGHEPAALSPIGRWPAPATRVEFQERVSEIRAKMLPSYLVGIGITAPGLIEGTTCRWIPNLPYLDGFDLKGLFAANDVPLAVGNDAHFALLAEASLGAARGTANALLLAIGTGIGSAVLADGQIVRGAHGGACSFGWACADPADPGDDRLGWLERHASGRVLDDAAQRLPNPGDGAALIAAARAGDTKSVVLVERTARLIGTTLAGAVALLDPEIVVLAGGLSEATDMLGPPLRAALDSHLPPHLRGIQLSSGVFAAKAGLVGAAIAATRGAEWWRMP